MAACESEGEFLKDRHEPPVLVTERLVLRAPRMVDAEQLTRLANNIKVAAMMTGMPHPYTRGDAEVFICRTGEADSAAATYAVTSKQNGSFLGCASLSRDREGKLQVGFWLGEPHWGQGYATEAAHALVDLAFGGLAVERLYTRCRVANTASRRVIEKCGFQFTGIGLLNSIAAGQFSAEHFTLERRVWASLKSWR